MPNFKACNFGPLPVDLINALLGTELEPGDARLSAQAHEHMALDHDEDYPICIAVLSQAIAAPTFVGQAPGHARNFEMIRRMGTADGQAVLVAIGLEPDARGDYRVRSCYLITAEIVENRRQKGRLKVVLST